MKGETKMYRFTGMKDGYAVYEDDEITVKVIVKHDDDESKKTIEETDYSIFDNL